MTVRIHCPQVVVPDHRSWAERMESSLDHQKVEADCSGPEVKATEEEKEEGEIVLRYLAELLPRRC